MHVYAWQEKQVRDTWAWTVKYSSDARGGTCSGRGLKHASSEGVTSAYAGGV